MNIFLDKYANLILKGSLNLKSGDVLSINTEECNSEFAHILAEKAKEITGEGTYIQLIENGKVVDTEEATTEFPIAKKPTALLYLPTYKSYPEITEGSLYSAAELQKFRLLSEPLFNMLPALPFVSAPSVSREWAETIDEEMNTFELTSTLSDLLSLGEDDYLERLSQAKEILEYEKNKFNEINALKAHVFSEDGVDLYFNFLEKTRFESSVLKTSQGRIFVPTVYSSDIFRAIDSKSISGYLNITRPMMLFGKLVRNLSIVFSNGIIQDFSSDETSASLFKLYLDQDPSAGKASMLSIVEETNTANFIDYFMYPEWDRMRTTSLTLGGPRPEGIEEEAKTIAVDSLVSLYLPIGSDSLTIDVTDKDGNEYRIMDEGIIQEEL